MRFFGARLCLLAAALLTSSCTRRLPLPQSAGWDGETGRFTWAGGSIQLPRGCRYVVDQGTDSFEGHFTSPVGVVVRHDIGWYAGPWASRKNALRFEERRVRASRVWIAERQWPSAGGGTKLFAVTFPDAGCANFFIQSSAPEAGAVIDAIARGFPAARLLLRQLSLIGGPR